MYFDEIILQLHAEEAGESGGTAPAVDTSTEVNDNTGNDSQNVSGSGGTMGLRFDPRTGRPSISFISQQTEKKEEQQPEQQPQVQEQQVNNQTAAQTQQQQPQVQQPVQQQPEQQPQVQGTPLINNGATAQEVKPYTASELVLAMQSGLVDESRIPAEYAMQYAALKTQKAQAAQMAAQATNDEAAQQQNIEQQKAFYSRIENMAKTETLKALGITEDDLDAAESSDDTELTAKAELNESTLAWNRARIAEAIQHEVSANKLAQEKQQAVYNNINNYVAELQAKEPNWNEINVMMSSYYKTGLTYEEAVQVDNAIKAYQNGNITDQQADVLRQYYEKTRVAYYAKKNNLNTVPTKVAVPKVETRGNGNAGSGSAVTIESLKKAKTMKEKTAVIKQLLFR